MKKFIELSLFSWFIVSFLALQAVEAQVVLKLDKEKSSMTIDGTSSLHDWTSKVNEIEGQIELSEKLVKKLKKGERFDKVTFSAKVKSIESGRGNTMDNRTHEALKAEEHPEITFSLKDGTVTQLKGSEFIMNAKGDLTIAGMSKPVELVVPAKKVDDDTFAFNGLKEIDMTEFGIKPPSAMFGTIETGKDVTVKFDLVFSR